MSDILRSVGDAVTEAVEVISTDPPGDPVSLCEDALLFPTFRARLALRRYSCRSARAVAMTASVNCFLSGKRHCERSIKLPATSQRASTSPRVRASTAAPVSPRSFHIRRGTSSSTLRSWRAYLGVELYASAATRFYWASVGLYQGQEISLTLVAFDTPGATDQTSSAGAGRHWELLSLASESSCEVR